MCGSQQWSASAYVLLPITSSIAPGHMVLGGPSLPLLPVICNVCGFTVLVNAIVAGIIPPEAP